MPSFTLTKEIAAPPAEVYAWFTDLAKAPERIKGIKKIEILTDAPFGPGMRFRETRLMFGKDCTETMEIGAVEPGKSYTVMAHSCGAHFITMFHFLPSATGTTVRMDFSSKAVSFFAKLFAPLSYLMMGPMKKCVNQDMEDLKKGLESNLVSS